MRKLVQGCEIERNARDSKRGCMHQGSGPLTRSHLRLHKYHAPTLVPEGATVGAGYGSVSRLGVASAIRSRLERDQEDCTRAQY
jgi:hypothetical protein